MGKSVTDHSEFAVQNDHNNRLEELAESAMHLWLKQAAVRNLVRQHITRHHISPFLSWDDHLVVQRHAATTAASGLPDISKAG